MGRPPGATAEPFRADGEGWSPARLPAPRAHALPRPARILESEEETSQTRTIRLDLSLQCEPGQFVFLWLPGLDEKPFSVMEPDPLAFAIAAVGPFTRAVHSLPIGATIWVRGPLGQAYEPRGSDHLLVGGGYGAAPLLFLGRRLLERGDRVRAVIGARTDADLLLVAQLREAGCTVEVTTEDGSAGVRGLVTDVVGPVLADGHRPDTLYACGPHGMLRALEALAARHGVPAQLAWEAYMRCGMGLCGSCEHEGRLLCTEGPVLATALRRQ